MKKFTLLLILFFLCLTILTFGQTSSRDVPSVNDIKLMYADCQLLRNSLEKDFGRLQDENMALRKELDDLKKPADKKEDVKK